MKPGKRDSRVRWAAVIAVIALGAPLCAAAKDLSVEDLKRRVTSANVQERPSLCISVSEKQLDAATKLYAAGENEKARTALADVSAFSGLARDYAIQSRRSEKQSEIAIRKMTRKLTNLKHAVDRDDQETIQKTIDQMEEVRDALLNAMFSEGKKK